MKEGAWEKRMRAERSQTAECGQWCYTGPNDMKGGPMTEAKLTWIDEEVDALKESGLTS